MRVIHVVPAVSEEASGPSYGVPRLCESIIKTGADVQLVALHWSCVPASLPYLRTFPLGLGPRRLGVSPKMRNWLEAEAASNRVDLIHNHSLWMMPNVYSGWACSKGRCRLVVSPHGTLSAWARRRSALQKKIFWHVFHARALRAAACFHATAESECEDIRRLGFNQPICLLPHGIDVPPLEQTPKSGRRQLLFLGRIHPIKGLDLLLRAWQAVEHRFPDWDLRIAGPDNGGHLADLQRLVAQLQLKRVLFCGPLYSEQKLRAYRAASLFVLPTHSENFGVTVSEALAAGTPAIVTRGAPWAGLLEHGAGWWIDIGAEPLAVCLEQALSESPQRLRQMGQAGHEWMKRDFSWDRIGTQFLATYRWLLNDGEKPPCVRLT